MEEVIPLLFLAAFLAAVFILGSVLLAHTPRVPPRHGEPRLKGGMVDPTSPIAIGMAGPDAIGDITGGIGDAAGRIGGFFGHL